MAEIRRAFMPLHPQLVIMAKQPLIGRAKTRLARDIGAVEALRFVRVTGDTLLRRVARNPRWRTLVAVTPDSACAEKGFWPADIPRIAQGAGDLGARMGRLFRTLPQGPVLIIGSDIPDITRRHIAEGFTALRAHDTVLGPAEDGGYWLIGMKRRPRIVDIFEGVRWSGEHAMEDTMRNIAARGMSCALLDTLADIDTGADLAAWRGRA